MKLQKQLIMNHNLEAGIYGDCFRTCIAILLNMDAADVPHFVEQAYHAGQDFNSRYADNLARRWLRERGYALMSVVFHASAQDEHIRDLTDGMPYMLTGRSPRYPDVCHCVIAQGGLNAVWCPTVGDIRGETVQPWKCRDGNGEYYTVDMIVKRLEA